jgi:hypothetical protein
MITSALLASILPTLLTIIIVVAGVVGTVLTVNQWVKWGIVALIVLAGIGTFVQSYQAARDTDFLKGALSTMLASMPETPGFDDAIFDAAFSIAKQHGYYISRSVKMGGGQKLYFLSPEGSKGDTVGAVLPVESGLKGDLYVAYVAGTNMRSILEKAIFGIDAASGSSPEKTQQAYLEDLRLTCVYILREELDRRKIDTPISAGAEFDPPTVTCASQQDERLHLTLTAGFITRIKPMARGERNAQAYEHFADQAAKLPN